MPVLKLVCLLVVVLLLATPAHQLGEKEWKKLVSALFTGAKLSDGNGGLLIQGELLEILANHTNDWQIKKRIKRYPIKRYPIHRQYFPRLTASYAECSDGSINHVSFSSGRSHKSHAENKVVRKISPRNHEHGIAISFSPCDCCVDKISDKFGQLSCHSRPVIYICWVHKYPKSNISCRYIRLLIRRGFNVKVWETEQLLYYLLQHAPSPELHDELSEAYENTSAALSERDDITQGLIDSERESDESDDDEEEAYWGGWGNSSRYDDDNNEPGAGGATGGGGGGGACCYGYSNSNKKKTSSSSSPRGTGATACWKWSSNHFVAVALPGLWVSSYILFKVSTKHYSAQICFHLISVAHCSCFSYVDVPGRGRC